MTTKNAQIRLNYFSQNYLAILLTHRRIFKILQFDY